jgi:hypothetical protein
MRASAVVNRRPGGNLTGARELGEKRLELLKELTPGIARVAFLGTRLSWKSYSSGANAALIPPVFAPRRPARAVRRGLRNRAA